jgi:hypothetical protein
MRTSPARGWLAAAVVALAMLSTSTVRAQPAPPPIGALKSLGEDRYQVGRIVVDKRARRFSVPGRVHAVNVPLEYLATAPKGMKEYETLFELDTTGSEFNLACLLIGLERDPKLPRYQQFDRVRLVGQRVAIFVEWGEPASRRRVPAAEALLNPEAGVAPDSVEWVYTGAPATRGATFAPDITGTLIGFVHDANSIIESTLGIGIGAYGSVRGNAMLPPVGSPIDLVVEAQQAPR